MKSKVQYVHIFNRDNPSVIIDRRTDNLREGHLRSYEPSSFSLNRLMKVLQHKPVSTGLYQNGFTLWYSPTIKKNEYFWGN